MCSCQWNYVCARCSGTPQDYRYFLEVDPRELEDDEREEARASEVAVARAER